MKLLGTISVDFDVTDQLLIKFSASFRYWRKELEYKDTYIKNLQKAYDSVRREVLQNVLTGFGIIVKLGRLIKIGLNKT
jgi:hypothetical protein